jgi:FMN phosphatase YigB (HAD superfamily)
MEIKSPITTLIFDFGGVIINLDLPECIENLRKTGFEDVEQFLSNFGQKDFFLQYENGQIDTAEFRNQIRRRQEDGKYRGIDKTVRTKRQIVNSKGQDIYQQTAIKTAISRYGCYLGLEGKTDFEKYKYQVGKFHNE